MTDDWDSLVKVTEALYTKAQQGLRPILDREAGLRADLARLDSHARVARDTTPEATAMRGIGADVAWHTWLARKKRQLNTELAQVLALKEARLGKVRTAHARQTVARETAAKHAATRAASKATSLLEQAIEMDVARKLRDQ